MGHYRDPHVGMPGVEKLPEGFLSHTKMVHKLKKKRSNLPIDCGVVVSGVVVLVLSPMSEMAKIKVS